MIEYVRCSQLEAHARSFVQLETLCQSGIKHDVARPNDNTLRGGSEMTRLGRGKCCWIEPTADSSLAGRQVGITQDVRPNCHVCGSSVRRERRSCRVGPLPNRR